MRSVLVCVYIVVTLLAVAYVVECCNEVLCASLVSRCQLIKACDCDMSEKKNCTCCHNCQLCLAQLYSECCSCVDMCPKPDPEDTIGSSNTIEELPDPIPELFNVLTEEEDSQLRWTIHSYPVYYESLYSKHMNRNNEKSTDSSHTLSHPVNCTVAFMSKCMSAHKCKRSCKSMGAAKYRWTHNEGCCQCIGHTCIDYGLNEPMCLLCRGEEDESLKVMTGMETEADVIMEETAIDSGLN